MPFYTFRLDQFRIDDTRALNDDTDLVAITLKVGQGDSFTLTKQMGDVDNGNHDVSLEFTAVQIDEPNTAIALAFSIVNGGHNAGKIEDELKKGLDKLAMPGGKALGASEVEIAAVMAVVDVALVALFADCDGTVAADTLTALRSEYDNLIPANGRVFTHTKFYPGSESPVGCGGNSKYKVTLTLIRTDADNVNQPDTTKAFIILSRSSGMVLDVTGASMDDGAMIQQFPDNGGLNQHWQLVSVDSGFFQVRSLNSGLLLEVTSPDDHAQIQQFHETGSHNQHWEFDPVPVPPTDLPFPVLPAMGLFFKVRSRLSGKVLDVPGRSADPNTVIQQFSDHNGDNQLWQLISVGEVTPVVVREISFPSVLSFPSRHVGEPSDPRPLRISNPGTLTVTVFIPPSPHLHDPNFVWDLSGDHEINPGESLELNITFAPSREGNNTGELRFTSNASGSPHTVQLSGQGLEGHPQ